MRDFSKFFPIFVHRCVVAAASQTGMPKTRCLENSPEDFKAMLEGCHATFEQGGVKWTLQLTSDGEVVLELLPGQEGLIGGRFKPEFYRALAREFRGE